MSPEKRPSNTANMEMATQLHRVSTQIVKITKFSRYLDLFSQQIQHFNLARYLKTHTTVIQVQSPYPMNALFQIKYSRKNLTTGFKYSRNTAND